VAGYVRDGLRVQAPVKVESNTIEIRNEKCESQTAQLYRRAESQYSAWLIVGRQATTATDWSALFVVLQSSINRRPRRSIIYGRRARTRDSRPDSVLVDLVCAIDDTVTMLLERRHRVSLQLVVLTNYSCDVERAPRSR